MQRLSIVTDRVYSVNTRTGLRLTRLRHVRRLATETTPLPTANAVPPPPPPKKKGRHITRTVLLYSSVLMLGVYGVGTYTALHNDRFHDFFVEFVPYGERVIETAERFGLEAQPVKTEAIVEAGRAAVERLERAAKAPTSTAQAMVEKAKSKVQESSENAKEGMEKLKATSETLKTTIMRDARKAQDITDNIASEIKETSIVLSEDVAELARKAEDALNNNGINLLKAEPSSSSQDVSNKDESVPSDKPTYTDQLPLGFEPPPGYVLPSKPTPALDVPIHPPVERPAAPSLLPLVAPSVSSFASTEPVISQLANTIDNLAAFLKDNPSASVNSNAKEVLDVAQTDLANLGERLQRMKEEERARLEDKLEEQAREFTVQLLQQEIDAQDKLDLQEQDWQKHFDQERQIIIRDYRAKLEAELQAQSEIINERLKEEVIAQGIELQRRWIREIKVRVEEERGGRLAKLDELAADLKRLSRVTFDNSVYLDENLRLHALWSSVRALSAVVQDATVRRPFREELRILRHVAIAGGAREDPVIAVALDTLEDSDVPDVGVEPFSDLASWFTTSVAPRVSTVALVPDQNAGVLSYLASSFLSSFRFKPRGLVQGDDVLSVLARAEYYMNEKDLDSAARELNQLKGPARLLLSDWLDAARKRLEVLQAIEVVQSQATLASLLLV